MTVPAGETPLDAIRRACDELDALEPTLLGARAHELTRDIRDATHQIEVENAAFLTQLLDAQEHQ